ncbi:MAG: C2H2-type zinc finger protein [Oscillospiraceae bacterium]|nr:C2H2-type zinc finger protein [Oscillospiraceae bacterium]
MGWVSTREDIIEKKSANGHFVLSNFTKTIDLIYKCPICKELFRSNDNLFSHMRLEHNQLLAFLLLNERIIPPGEHYIETFINSLYLFSVENIGTLYINGEIQNITVINGNINLKAFSENDFETLIIEVDKRKWTIYKNKLRTISPLVDSFVSSFNQSIASRIRPDSEMVRKQISINNFDICDTQYINGFYEYSLACLANNRDNKDNLYYAAYDKLYPYIESNARALLVIKIICFRFLWIDRLIELCEHSDVNEFKIVCGFFKGVHCNFNTTVNNYGKIFKIFVEDDEHENMQAIINFMRGDVKSVKRYLGKALDLTLDKKVDSNLKDKVYLLKARLSEYDGNADIANYYYNSIVSPSIKKEVLSNVEINQ